MVVCGGFGETATNHQKNRAKNPSGQPIPQNSYKNIKKSSKNLDTIESLLVHLCHKDQRRIQKIIEFGQKCAKNLRIWTFF